MNPRVPDSSHQRPEGTSDGLVAAVGKLSEAFEWVERARGHLYSLHHLIGRADFLLEDAVELLRKEGEEELASMLEHEMVGRNVLDGRWTFQIVEEFDQVYYEPFQQMETNVRNRLMEGKRHVFEAELKEKRRSKHQPGHESRPPKHSS